ncbi:oxysterol-binding protein-related protein 6-like isoform X2 [Daktulosphaira vitifoliae]|uniref:oxysterol-binding protein-related protein 6-like isoform X2 n=1 Tax=Daktulosphaira vitifoliae TaxID=58002 RepID=UPI0021AA2C82|nr:oxysterol-binding protein-related protein 6-like isoform X2 [Daktulosphaira vitifoliae]
MASGSNSITIPPCSEMDRKKSPQLSFKRRTTVANSDSDVSVDSNTPSVESKEDGIIYQKRKLEREPGLKKVLRRGTEWEIVEGLKDGQRYEKKPEICRGYLYKKRKWPLKGWHKRYFVLDKGILKYGKSPLDMSKGKIHGQVDIGLSVISTKYQRKRLDIDAEEFIYHLKAKTYEAFSDWVKEIKHHRLYRQHILTYGFSKQPPTQQPTAVNACSSTTQLNGWCSNLVDSATSELKHVEQNMKSLNRILDQLESVENDVSGIDGVTTTKKSTRFRLRKKKSGGGSWGGTIAGWGLDMNQSSQPSSKTPIDLIDSSVTQSGIPSHNLSNSNPSLIINSSPSDLQLYADFVILAKDIQNSFKSIMGTITEERNHLLIGDLRDDNLTNYRSALNRAIKQNSELRAKLNSIHTASDISTFSDPVLSSSLSYSSGVSGSEVFFDAEEYIGGKITRCEEDLSNKLPSNDVVAQTSDTSSEAGSLSSEDGSISSENSDGATSEYNNQQGILDCEGVIRNMTGRRTKLPCPKPDTEGLSLWNLLCKNIGKDLSQVSMPVALNEPLNMLQRMCEELEYSELLDKASEQSDVYERMVYVAAFAVSSYGSSYYRAGSKPFNPLLGETYECIRDDKGFKFVAEQVSHHPPISVCHAESKNFIFWQDVRIKTKFWGKSMEFQPTGYVNVQLICNDSSDHYRWNKVTTCVHNLFGGQRSVDQYGELKIINLDKNISCKLTFVKASYFSAKRHEIHGVIVDDNEGKVVRKLFGKWNEALYCGVAPSAKCIWRPGTMPEDYELYYGFTRFAMELNELDSELAKYLPKTDTRFRPDQRLLEEGDLNRAESMKLNLEQMQRERRKRKEESGEQYNPKWFRRTIKNGVETWEYNHQYWEIRRNPSFANYLVEKLWDVKVIFY